MEKKIKTIRIDFDFHRWTDYKAEISDIKQDLMELEKLGAEYIDIDSFDNYVEIKAYKEELETDEEYEKRTANERLGLLQYRNWELKELERLKKKYPNQ